MTDSPSKNGSKILLGLVPFVEDPIPCLFTPKFFSFFVIAFLNYDIF